MSSAAQIDANRRNAQLSTGPQTDAGKQTSSQNSFRHGLASAKVVLPHEDPAAFEELKNALLDDHKPAGAVEIELVSLLAAAMWRLKRANRVHDVYLDQTLGQASSDEALAALISSINDQGFAKIERYRAQAERAFYRALKEVQTGPGRPPQTGSRRRQEANGGREKVGSRFRPYAARLRQ